MPLSPETVYHHQPLVTPKEEEIQEAQIFPELVSTNGKMASKFLHRFCVSSSRSLRENVLESPIILTSVGKIQAVHVNKNGMSNTRKFLKWQCFSR